jgi:prefoldin subunit 5
MHSEPVDIGTPYVTREDMQDSINELYVRVDHLQRTVDRNNEKIADMERSLALFVHLISDKLGVSEGETNG